MTTTILPTRNAAWGFWGTISRIENDPAADPAKAWEIASRRDRRGDHRLARGGARLPRQPPRPPLRRRRRERALRRARRSKEAIDAAIARWMGWRIDRKTSRETGIPRGLPYLTGFANHFAIMAELPY